MSQTDVATEKEEQKSNDPWEGDDIDRYRTPTGPDPADVNVDDDHVLDDAYPDEDDEWKVDARAAVKNLIDLYDRPEAALREYFANAETAELRRARAHLREVGVSEDQLREMNPRQTFDRARSEVGYEPIIEVTEKVYEGDKKEIIIKDNGIGISLKEWKILTEIGLSASHGDGKRLGTFGQGILSGFKIVGKDGLIRLWTNSYQDDVSYSVALGVGGPKNRMPGGRDRYGTTFQFVVANDVVDNISVKDATRRYGEMMAVPVYYERIRDGKKVDNEEYPAKMLGDDLPDHEPKIVYEDEYVRAVTSPAITSKDTKTYLISVPIDRNDMGYGSNKYDSPWHFHALLKREDGMIYTGPNEGLIPINNSAYEDLPSDRKDEYIRKGEMDDEDRTLPVPTGDRDRLEHDHNDPFWKDYVSKNLEEQYKERAMDLIERVDSVDDMTTLSSNDLTVFMKAISDFGPGFFGSHQKFKDEMNQELGVDIDDELAKRLCVIQKQVSLCPRGKRSASRQRYRKRRSIYKVLIMAEDDDADVYMTASTGGSFKDKASVAWAMNDDNQVVVVGGTNKYHRYRDLFGWKVLKNIDLYNLDQYDLDQDTIDQYERTQSSSGGVGHGKGGSGRRIRVRLQSRNKKYQSTFTGKEIKDSFENGESLKVGRFDKPTDTLIALRSHVDEENSLSNWSWMMNKSAGVGMIKTPKYVYEYLKDVPGVYTPMEYIRESGKTEVDLFDGGTKQYRDFNANDLIITIDEDHEGWFDSFDAEEIIDTLSHWFDLDDVPLDERDFAIVPAGDLNGARAYSRYMKYSSGSIDEPLVLTASSKPSVYNKSGNFNFTDFNLYARLTIGDTVGGMYWDMIFGSDRPNWTDENIDRLDLIKKIESGVDETIEVNASDIMLLVDVAESGGKSSYTQKYSNQRQDINKRLVSLKNKAEEAVSN